LLPPEIHLPATLPLRTEANGFFDIYQGSVAGSATVVEREEDVTGMAKE